MRTFAIFEIFIYKEKLIINIIKNIKYETFRN